MMLKKVHFVVLAVALFSMLFMGCGKKDIYLTNYAKVQRGVTTKLDVLGMYGKPKMIFPNHDGSEKWSYTVEFELKNYSFDFYFDKSGVVINKSKFLEKWP